MVESGSLHSEGEQSVENIIFEVMHEVIDEVTLGMCFEIHRACKSGNLFLADTDPESRKEHEVIERHGFDVFGQAPTRKQVECVCPNCQRHLAASRFAPHLEKCMGMGRNSSRIASRRIASNSTKRDSDDSGEEDNLNDNDWSYHQDTRKPAKKIKKEKSVNSPRIRAKNNKYKNGDVMTVHTGTPEASILYETMTLEEKRIFLLNNCGVISDTTRKVCMRSVRCSVHTEEDRRHLRSVALHPESLAEALEAEPEDIHIDIDGYDDVDTQSLRESLQHQWEASSNSSPADSTSTINSTGSRKRGPTSKASGNKGAPGKKRKTGPKAASASGPGGNTASSSGSSVPSLGSTANASLYDFP